MPPPPPPPGAPLFGGPASGLMVSPAGGAGGGQGFSLTVAYTATRTRPGTASTILPGVLPGFVSDAGQQQLNVNLTFRPTQKWQANWTTVYDFETQQFGEHYLRLERDLHRWHASFAFVKSPNGNFAFTFYVTLLDEPDIKFNYEQQTLQQ